MKVPQWLALIIAGVVILYGVYRVYLAVGGPDDEERSKHRRGLYATPRWHHGLVGVLLVLAGGALIATALGWNPVSNEPQPPAGVQPKHGGREVIITPK